MIQWWLFATRSTGSTCTRWRILAIVALPGYAVQQEHFPGQYYDQETGLFYNGYRDYDPTGGRYIESDPMGLDGGQFSTYAYVNSSPTMAIDPKGLDIYYANHPVAMGFNHSKIIIIPDDQDAWANDPRFQNFDSTGKRFATVGAGPDSTMSDMNAGINRPRDVSQTCSLGIRLDLPSFYTSENDAINTLFDMVNYYNQMPLRYTLFPDGLAQYNSNSFIRGIGQAAGFTMPVDTWHNTPGYDNPVPLNRF